MEVQKKFGQAKFGRYGQKRPFLPYKFRAKKENVRHPHKFWLNDF